MPPLPLAHWGKRALAKGIQQVVFDRGGNLYHGQVTPPTPPGKRAFGLILLST